jgi:predicted PurR-regulated permease PerM
MLKWFFFLLFLWFLYYVREVFPPFIMGGIIAYLLLPLVSKLTSFLPILPLVKKLSPAILERLAVAIIYLLFIAAIVLIFKLFGASAIEEFSKLVSQRREIVTNLISQIATTFNWQIDVEQSANEILASIEQNFGTPGEIMHLGTLVSKGMLAVLVTVVSSIYFIVDSKQVGQFFLRFLPEQRQKIAIELSRQMNSILSKYVQGQLILITLMAGVTYTFLHFAFQLKYALLIAILSGFLEIIPVLGPILATTTATIVGIAQNGIDCGLLIILCYTGARQIEDYVIIPRVIGHYVELHPLTVIFAVLCGEVMAGALGMLIAIPVAASIKVILDFCYPPAIETGQ